jgi:outer membrane receptor protein involved in Fe transport
VTLQAGFDWRVFDVAGGHVTVSPNVNYYGHEYFSPFDSVNAPGTAQMNSELQQGGYSLVNMSLVWRRGRYALRAWVKNLTDTEALGYGLDLRGAGFPYDFLVPLPPRTFGLDARVSF